MVTLGLCGFFCFGVILVLLGANQADLARDLKLDLARTGQLASALALGLGVGVVAAGPLFDRFARRPLFIAAALLAGFALLSFESTTSFSTALLLMTLVGVGAGGYDTLFNAAVVERFGERSARPMSILHAAATIGAVAGPPLVAAIAARGHWTASFRWLGIAHLALAAAALTVRFPPPRERPAEVASESALSMGLAPFALVAFAYVGLEAAMTIFAVPYASDGLALDPSRGRFAISAFWLGLLVGRLAPLVLRGALDARVLIAAGTLGCGALAIGAGIGSARVEILFACVGLALGSVYPLMIALAGQRFPGSRGTAAGLAAGAGAAGGLAIPWVTGVIGDRLGIEFAVATLSGWTILIAVGGVAARRLHPGAQ